MAALRTAVSLGYRPGYIAASLVIALGAATAALAAARRDGSMAWRAWAALILGAAIAGMHYTAMAGLELTPLAGATPIPGAPPIVLGVAVALGTLVILFLGLLASLYDQRLNVLAAVEGGGVGYWELTFPDMNLHVSARGKEIFGHLPDAPFGQGDFLAALTPQERMRRDKLFHAALKADGVYDAEYELAPLEGRARWINIRGRVVSRRGRRGRMAGVVLDISERRAAFAAVAEAERRQRLLINELNHRVKNTLATVQSLARQTAKGAASLDAFRHDFDARLVALSTTHDLLTHTSWERAGLRDLVLQELRPYACRAGEDRGGASGPAACPGPGYGHGGARAGHQRGQVRRALHHRGAAGGRLERG
jgi:PAS domain-containing protein